MAPVNSSVLDHYEHLLAKHYEWMVGDDFTAQVQRQKQRLVSLGLNELETVVDLGCGPGHQAFAAAELGARRVVAIDTSPTLLAGVRNRLSDEPIELVNADIVTAGPYIPDEVSAFLCVGDTLTHLTSSTDVSALFRLVRDKLMVGGLLVLSYRDLSDKLAGISRFFTVRATTHKVMTCFIEDQGGTVLVHDLVYTFSNGAWEFEKSAYPKLVLPNQQVVAELKNLGFAIVHHTYEGSMHTIVARRCGN